MKRLFGWVARNYADAAWTLPTGIAGGIGIVMFVSSFLGEDVLIGNRVIGIVLVLTLIGNLVKQVSLIPRTRCTAAAIPFELVYWGDPNQLTVLRHKHAIGAVPAGMRLYRDRNSARQMWFMRTPTGLCCGYAGGPGFWPALTDEDPTKDGLLAVTFVPWQRENGG